MALFENLGKKIGEAAQTAAKKSGELVEVTKLSMNISSEEDKIQKLYAKIGKGVYQSFCSGSPVPEEFKGDCEAVRTHEETIKNLRAKILEVKNLKICKGCGAEVEINTVFCSKCGTKLD